MTNTQKTEKRFLILGYVLIFIGFIFNAGFFSFIMKRDGFSSWHSKLVIWLMQIVFISSGLTIIYIRKKIAKYILKTKGQLKQRFFILMAIFLFLSISFIVPEILVRITKPQKTYSQLLKLVKTGEYISCDFIPFTLKANNKIKAPSMEFIGKMVNVTTNSLGLRSQEITLKKPTATKRVLVLGDSYTYGIYVDDNETFCALLENSFKNENNDIEVVNAGFADGWSPAEHYCWLVNRGLDFNPDIIIYGFFIGNDINVEGLVWDSMDAQGLPNKISNPDIYVDENGIIRSKIKDEKTVGYSLIYRIPVLRESHLFILLTGRLEKIISNFRHKDNLGWGVDPFPFILKSMSDEKMLKQEGNFKKLVKGMSLVAQEHGARYLLLMIPVNFQVDTNLLGKVMGSNKFDIKRNYFEELKPWLENNNIEYLDLLKAMETQKGKYYPKNGEVHFNPEGHKFTAKELKLKLDELGWLK